MTPSLELVESPLVRAERASSAWGLEVWVKRDSDCHPLLGGSKARKLASILPHALGSGATDLITIGSAGSNHLLATAVHGASFGLPLHAIVTAHPDSLETRATLGALLVLGVAIHPVRGDAHILWTMARLRGRLRRAGRTPYLIAPGGSSRLGTAGVMSAMDELASQVERNATPWPEWIICPVGSAGLMAGLVAAARKHSLPTRIVGVKVRDGWATRPTYVAGMAQRVLGSDHLLRQRPMILDGRGHGYGRRSSEGDAAHSLLGHDGIELDATYTAKAAAVGLAAARSRGIRSVLLWASYARLRRSTATDVPPALQHLLL